MPYYKDNLNKLYFLSTNDVAKGGENFLPASCGRISDEETQTILNTPKVKTPAEIKAEAQATIDSLEQKSLMNRAVREWVLLKWELEDGPKRAELLSRELGRTVTVGEALATLPAYAKIKELDAQITQLRGVLGAT